MMKTASEDLVKSPFPLILIDKPSGPTSHDVVMEIKRRLGARKVGHAGTLDPLATGLLILGIDAATRKLGALAGLDKTYRATLQLGVGTDTQDADGEVIRWAAVPQLTEETIRSVLASCQGEISLQVPRYSAIKTKGIPLYKLARRGIPIDPPFRTTWIDSLSLEEWDRQDRLTFQVHCSSGTYVRALGEEIAGRLGTVGHIVALRRLAIGPYRVEAARQLSDFIHDEPSLARSDR